jgi:putative membrane protein
MKAKNWFKKFLAGMGIGAGAAIPGVSGSAVAVVLKVYESIIWAVTNFRKKFSRSFAILLPILLGIIFAVIPCVWLFDRALEQFVFGIICIFAGFLIGSFPGVVDEIRKVKITKKYIILAILGALFVIALGIVSVLFGGKMDLNSHFADMSWWFILILVPVGIIAAVALTVPGLSGSLILLILGFYKPLLENTIQWIKEILTAGDFSNTWKLFAMLGAFAIGVLIGVVITSKAMKFFIGKHHNGTYFAIAGFVFGSILVIFFNMVIFNYYLVWAGQTIEGYNPIMGMEFEIPIGILLLILCAILSYMLVRFSRKKPKEEKYDLGA